jgi:hypothetical protein
VTYKQECILHLLVSLQTSIHSTTVQFPAHEFICLYIYTHTHFITLTQLKHPLIMDPWSRGDPLILDPWSSGDPLNLDPGRVLEVAGDPLILDPCSSEDPLDLDPSCVLEAVGIHLIWIPAVYWK